MITEAMNAYYTKQALVDDEEWDTTALHSSDLSFCPTKIWARRNGLSAFFVDFDNRRQMAFGKLWEIEVSAALRAAGFKIVEQVEVKGSLFGVDIECHGDFDIPAENLYVEAKTSEFWSGWKNNVKYVKIPTEPKAYHLTQAAASAMLLKRANFTISTTDRNKGGHVEFHYKTAEYTQLIEDAVIERAQTRPGDEAPAFPAPVFDWECKTCPYAQCGLNKNPHLQVI
jgi:CRISPR/Cas system-associated exonuclease Cas4 (RecB family)